MNHSADIPGDNAPRDPRMVVKSDEPPRWGKGGPAPKYATDEERRKANGAAVVRCQTRYRVLAVRLKRLAKARGVTPEQMLDMLERADG